MNRRVCLFALFLTLAAPALARVGGGQHYSSSHSSSSSRSSSSHGSSSWSGGGSSSSGSWSSGSDGSTYGGDPWVLFFLRHPLFTLAVIGVAFVIWRAYSQG